MTDTYYVPIHKLRELVMDREAWRAAIHGVVKNQTQLSDWTELMWFIKFSSIVYESMYLLVRTKNYSKYTL